MVMVEPRESAEPVAEATRNPAGKWNPGWVALGLALATCLVFARSLSGQFIEFDDNVYVTRNPWVQQGLTVDSIRTAFSFETIVGSNWHPLTMVSHMADVTLFGLQPWGHHLTNVLVHSVSTAALFLLLYRMTGQMWPSVAAAVLFAWHPLRVESVSWVAERKDVLSVLFWILCCHAYLSWVERRSVGRYLLVAGLLVAGLLCKPMLVTLPCALVLLDIWPLRRVSGEGWTRLMVEKLPLFAIVVGFSALTFYTQFAKGVRSLDKLPLSLRAMNAIVSYVDYLGQFLWPVKLAVFYPHPADRLPLVQVLLCAAALAGITLWVARRANTQPYLIVGWLWYLGTMFPVSGIAQVGGHARTDRFTYIPMIGIAMLLAWGVNDWVEGKRERRQIASWTWGAWMALLVLVTWVQQGYWQNTLVLFQHAIDVTERNFLSHQVVGNELVTRGQFAEGLAEFEKSLAVRADFDQAMYGKAFALHNLQRKEEAVEAYAQAMDLGMQGYGGRCNYALALMDLNRHREAREQFELALQEYPDSLEALTGLGMVALAEGNGAEGVKWLREALEKNPGFAFAAERLAWVLATAPEDGLRDGPEALRLAELASRATQNQVPRMLTTWAAALAENGRFDEAVTVARQAQQLADATSASDPQVLALANELSAHLERYERQKPVRDETLSTAGSGDGP
jgi:tetratricopeptide (TPR) repeat protein